MARRNSPKEIEDLDDLNRLGEIVRDKRNGKRADAKKSRRNRHYEKQFIRNAITGMGITVPPEEASKGLYPPQKEAR